MFMKIVILLGVIHDTQRAVGISATINTSQAFSKSLTTDTLKRKFLEARIPIN